MRSSLPPTPHVHVALLDLAGGTLHPLSGDWGWVPWKPGQSVPLISWLRLIHPRDRPALQQELAGAARREGADSRRLRLRLGAWVTGTPAGARWVGVEWRVARRTPDGQATHLSVTLRFLPGGDEELRESAPPVPPPAAVLSAGADTATFTWTGGAPSTPALGLSPALVAWLGNTPTTLNGLLAHLDVESAWALRDYLEGPDPAAPLERLGELRGWTEGLAPEDARPVRLSVAPPVRVGEARVVFGILRDVGEGLRLQGVLAERGRRLEEAQTLARLGSWRFDLRRGTLAWSDGLFELLEQPPGTPDLQAWLAGTHPEDRDRVRAALTGEWPGTGLHLHHRLLRPGGEERVIEVRGRAEAGPDGQPALLYGTAQDVTGQVRTETHERGPHRLQAALLHAAAAVATTLDQDEVLGRLIGSVGRIVPFDAASVLLLGPDGETLRVALRQCGPGAPLAVRDLPQTWNLGDFPALAESLRQGLPCVLEDLRTFPEWGAGLGLDWIGGLLLHPILLEGQLLGLLALSSAAPGAFAAEQAQSVGLFMGYAGAALHNSRLYEAARHEARRARVLADLAAELNGPLGPQQVADAVVRSTRTALGRGCVSVARYDPLSGEFCRLARAGFEDHPGAASAPARDRPPLPPLPVPPAQPGTSTRVALLTEADPEAARVLAELGYRQALRVSMARGGKFLASLNVGLLDPVPLSADEQDLVVGIAQQATLAFLNADLRAENVARVRDLTVLNLTAQHFAQQLDATSLSNAMVDAAVEHFGAECAWVAVCTPAGRLEPLSTRPQPLPELGPEWPGAHPLLTALPPEEPVALHPDVCPGWWTALQARGLRSAALVPVPGREPEDRPVVLLLASRAPGVYTPQRLHVLSTLAHQLGTALRNARLFQTTRERLTRLEALHELDTAISTAHSLDHVLDRVAEIAAAQPGVSAVAVGLCSPHAPLPEYVATRGLAGVLPTSAAPGGEDWLDPALLEGRPLRVDNVPGSALTGPETWPRRVGARGYQALPLSAQGQVLGVIEYTWHAEDPDPQTHVFLRVLADQAAIAAQGARLHRDLQRQTTSLARAYDETLEGWSRALDLRDRETEGHTRRVTNLTLRLARAFGMDPEDLTHVRRGALLHDIGKMGIPDAILLKPGPLDPGEWEVMRRHATLALELLSPIGFLRPALDIPHGHHEKWDGSGYPRGLRGEAIPLPARLFAVVDVWDALTSDRPYRRAWTHERALAHIRAQSGAHFDPRVVEVFTAVMLERYPELAAVVAGEGEGDLPVRP